MSHLHNYFNFRSVGERDTKKKKTKLEARHRVTKMPFLRSPRHRIKCVESYKRVENSTEKLQSRAHLIHRKILPPKKVHGRTKEEHLSRETFSDYHWFQKCIYCSIADFKINSIELNSKKKWKWKQSREMKGNSNTMIVPPGLTKDLPSLTT